MKRIIAIFLVLMLFNFYSPVIAATINVSAATRVPLVLTEQATSKTIEAGDKIEANVAEDVIINNVLVFRKGNRAYFNVSDAKKAGFVGNAGNIYLINGAVYDANGIERGIDYSRKFVGDERTWPKVLMGVGIFLWPLLLFGFVKGGQAKINTGKIFEVSLRNDFVFKY